MIAIGSSVYRTVADAAIDAAVYASGSTAEVIVVANRCVDRTEAIAEASGAIVVRDTSRNIAAIRNAGVAASTGEVVVTIDADNVMHELALVEVNRVLDAGPYVGGGCEFVAERSSLGLTATSAVLRLALAVGRIGGVMYWCRFANLRGVPVIVCCRKFDSFGDWHMLGFAGRARSVIGSIRGTDTRFADEYYYDYNT